jgi:hypothetical protein
VILLESVFFICSQSNNIRIKHSIISDIREIGNTRLVNYSNSSVQILELIVSFTLSIYEQGIQKIREEKKQEQDKRIPDAIREEYFAL